MSLYRFVAANAPIPEVDCTGVQKIKVKDLARMKAEPPAGLSWEDFEEETEILYSHSEDALEQLHIFHCPNPPNGIEQYITSQQVYWLEGSLGPDCMQQLYHYIMNLPAGVSIELWSVWMGTKKQPVEYKRMDRALLGPSDLSFIRQENSCLFIEHM